MGLQSEDLVIYFKFILQAFKKRYAYLKQQQDTTYCLEFHKDDKKLEERGQIFLEMASNVMKV